MSVLNRVLYSDDKPSAPIAFIGEDLELCWHTFASLYNCGTARKKPGWMASWGTVRDQTGIDCDEVADWLDASADSNKDVIRPLRHNV